MCHSRTANSNCCSWHKHSWDNQCKMQQQHQTLIITVKLLLKTGNLDQLVHVTILHDVNFMHTGALANNIVLLLINYIPYNLYIYDLWSLSDIDEHSSNSPLVLSHGWPSGPIICDCVARTTVTGMFTPWCCLSRICTAFPNNDQLLISEHLYVRASNKTLLLLFLDVWFLAVMRM